MEKIEIKVTKTSTTIINAYILNQGEYQVDKCQFDFSSEYEGLVKKAVFVSNENEIDMVILNDECDIPYEILQNSTEFTLKVYGYQVENNELKERYSPTPRKIFLREGSYQGSKEVITPTQFEQYEQALHDGLEEVANVNIDVSKVGKVATIEIINRNGETKSASVTDGADFQYNWDGTKLGVKTDEEEEYQYVDLKGDKGDQGIQGIQGPQGEQGIQGIQGPQGIQGEAFTIKKTYSSVEEMNADFGNMQLGDYVMIASSVEVEDNAKLYTRGEEQWIFITDFSGATGIQGPQGPQGIQGIQGIQGLQGEKGDTGATGNGIASIQKTSTSGLVDTYTITYTNGTTTTFEVTNGEDGEVTQAQFDKLQHRVGDLETNQLTDTKTGTNISIDDAHETEIVEGRLSKESTQNTTTGKNKIGLSDGTYQSTNNNYSLTITNGIVHFEGNVGNTSAEFYIPLINNVTLENGNTNTFSIRADGTVKNYVTAFRILKSNIAIDSDSFGKTFTSLVSKNTSITYTQTEEETFAYLYFYIASNTTETNCDLYFQLESGSTATEYEPYTGGIASPNPDYPQEVKTVKGYKNLFDKSLTPKLNNQAQATILDTGLRITNSTAGTYRYCIYSLFDVSSYVGKKLTLHVDISASASNIPSLNLIICNSNGENRTTIDAITQSGNITITVPTLTGTNTYLGMIFYANTNGTANANDYVDYTNLILVEGTEVLPYVPYGTNWIYNKIIGKNLFDGVFRQGGWNGSSNIRCISTNAVVVNDSNLQYTVSTNLDTTVYKWSIIVSDRKLPASSYNTILDIGWKTSSSAIVNIPSISNSAYMYISLAKLDGTSTIDVNVIKDYQYQIEKANSATPYEAYKESIITLPLNGNEIAGIGDYKDELIVDRNGHCWLNKKISKVVLDGSELNWDKSLNTTFDRFILGINIHGIVSIGGYSNYFKMINVNVPNNLYELSNNGNSQIVLNYSLYGNTTLADFKTWLSTHNTEVYYVSVEEQLIDLNYNADIRLFNGVNNISNGDDMDMVIKYVQDISIIINEIKASLDNE